MKWTVTRRNRVIIVVRWKAVVLPNSPIQITNHRSEFGEEWVGLKHGEIDLTNNISAADWHTQPAAPWACWHCGQAWCCQHRLSRIVRTTDQMLWMAPYFSTYQYMPYRDIRKEQLFNHSLIIKRADWESVRNTVSLLPPFESFEQIIDHDVCHLWLQERPAYAVEPAWDSLSKHLRNNFIASDPLDLSDAVQIIESQLQCLQRPPKHLTGTFRSIGDDASQYNTLYLDDPGGSEFVVFMTISPSFPLVSSQKYFCVD